MKIGPVEFTFKDIEEGFGLVREKSKKLIVKNHEGKIQIVFAIVTENDLDNNRLNNDLIAPFYNYLDSRGLSNIFEVSSLNSKDAAQIKDIESSKKYLEKTKKHLIVYGSIKKRKNPQDTYIFSLDATILHSPIPVLISSNISKDFSEIFPRKVLFPENDELIGFEVTKEWLGIAVRYLVGVAAMVSGNFGLSQKLFSELNDELNKVKDEDPVRNKFRQKLPTRIVENSKMICVLLYSAFVKSGNIDTEPIKRSKEFFDIVLSYNPNDEQIINIAAIYYYLIENDLDECEKILTSTKRTTEPTWRINLAFVYALKGRLLDAKKMYDKASRHEFGGTNVINDAEVFLTKVIEISPEKNELLFCRGYINFKLKGDYALAKKDFDVFIENSGVNTDQEVVRLTTLYLRQINLPI